ncbi:MAG: M15 family metallopeptidase [Treponema sp.]|nr:M15 family metallopeptidase [Treponema sp.]
MLYRIRRSFFWIPVLAAAFAGVFLSCERPQEPPPRTAVPAEPDLGEAIMALAAGKTANAAADAGILINALNGAGLPPELAVRLEAAAAESPAFILDLLSCLEGDPFLRRLVDKSHPLPEGYEPEDLAELSPGSYEVGRRGLMLRRSAAEALERMAAAARAGGVVLTASSAYRSYAYQVEVYGRNVQEMGREAADRESSRPGYSQHQTGLAVDFGSIDDSFARTGAGRWVLEHAARFGWSLSFPDGYEDATGYRWESWHYRYVGEDLAAFIDTWFDGIQQYALQFIHAWEGLRRP